MNENLKFEDGLYFAKHGNSVTVVANCYPSQYRAERALEAAYKAFPDCECRLVRLESLRVLQAKVVGVGRS